MKMNDALAIMVENASTFKERNAIYALEESDANKYSNELITSLYKSISAKSNVDFGDIPNSKGDITRFEGYSPMMESLEILKQLADKSSIKIHELDTIFKAVSNIVANREKFEQGFKLNKDFIILQYNVIVACCVESTSLLISSYVDYIRNVNSVDFKIVRPKNAVSSVALSSLETFNRSVASGEFNKVMTTVIKSGSEGFTGVDIVVIPAVIIIATATLVTMMREAVFVFYYSRMKIADYLKLQSMFLDMNRNNVMANTSIPAAKKNEIIKKQAAISKDLLSLSDKIKVDVATATTKSKNELTHDNKELTMDKMEQNIRQNQPLTLL